MVLIAVISPHKYFEYTVTHLIITAFQMELITRLLFHVLRVHMLQLGPSLSHPAFSVNPTRQTDLLPFGA